MRIVTAATASPAVSNKVAVALAASTCCFPTWQCKQWQYQQPRQQSATKSEKHQQLAQLLHPLTNVSRHFSSH
jgi:hypothetical protein